MPRLPAKDTSHIRPSDRREARLWNYFNKQDDLFWPIRQWPTWMQRMALKEYKGNRDRFGMFFFFVSNGLNANTAKHWIMAKDVSSGGWDKGFLLFGDYDTHAYRQFRQLERQLNTGTLFKGNKLLFDMTKRRIIRK